MRRLITLLLLSACGGRIEPDVTGEVVQGIVSGPDDACVEVTPEALNFAMCSDCQAGGAVWSTVRSTCADAAEWTERCAELRCE